MKNQILAILLTIGSVLAIVVPVSFLALSFVVNEDRHCYNGTFRLDYSRNLTTCEPHFSEDTVKIMTAVWVGIYYSASIVFILVLLAFSIYVLFATFYQVYLYYLELLNKKGGF